MKLFYIPMDNRYFFSIPKTRHKMSEKIKFPHMDMENEKKKIYWMVDCQKLKGSDIFFLKMKVQIPLGSLENYFQLVVPLKWW